MVTYFSVVHANTRDDTPGSQELKAELESRAQSYDFDDHVCASAIGELLHSLLQAFSISLEVPGLSTQVLSLLQSALHAVHSEQMLWLKIKDIDKRTQSHGTQTEQHDRALLHLLSAQFLECVLGREETGGEDVSHEDQGFLLDAFGCLHDCALGIGNANVVGLAAIKLGTSEEQGVGATTGEALLAVEAYAAGCGEWRDHQIAFLEGGDLFADRGDTASEFVTHNESGIRGLVATEHM